MHTPSSIRPDMVALACFPVSKPATRSTPEEVAALGTSLIPLMSDDQLSAAMAAYFSSAAGTRKSYLVGYRHLRQVVANHWRSCIKMPAGGAHAGGAQQSGFEVQLVPSFAVKQLFQEWPNYESVRLGHSWECRTMEQCASVLGFAEKPSGWGALNGKPIPKLNGSPAHSGVLLVGPPCTAVWRMRGDGTTSLSLRFPLIIHTATATILPPDDVDGVAFYVDPPDRPGMHRDLFRDWGRKVVGELHEAGFQMERPLLRQMPRQYHSGEESSASEMEEEP